MVGSPVVQKVGTPNTVVVSGGQVFAASPGQQIVVGGNQVVSSPGQVGIFLYFKIFNIS